MDHVKLGMGCGIICGVFAYDLVYLFELLAREGNEEEAFRFKEYEGGIVMCVMC